MDLLYKKVDIVLYLIFIGKGGYNMLIILDKLVFVRGGGGRRSFDFLTLFLFNGFYAAFL